MIELTVALAISALLLILVLNMVDLNARVGRVQTDLSTVQQAQRVVHNLLGDQIRMAGRGGLPVALAVDVADNVAASFLVAGNETVDGSDVLRMRGAFENLYLVDSKNAARFSYNDVSKVGTVVVDSLMPSAISQQPLDALQEAISNGTRMALIMVSARNNATYAVVELDTGGSSIVSADVNGDGATDAWEKRASIRFSGDPSVTLHNGLFLDLSSTPGAWPGTITRVGVVGILQEYQYYIRDTDSAADGNRPKLSRAELFPNTSDPVGDASNGRVDIADNVADFQISRAFDLNGNLSLDENYDAPESDEWLGNNPGDGQPTAPATGFVPLADYIAAGWDPSLVTHVAISSLIQTQGTDRQYLAPPIAGFENHVYNEPASPVTTDDLIQRRYRRRLHRTVIDMRNL